MRRNAEHPTLRNVVASSPAGRAGLRPGDVLLKINGRSMRDTLDFRFHAAEAENVCVLRDGKKHTFRIRGCASRDPGLEQGLEFEPMAFSPCGNRCLFCFVDQNPKGMRKSLYFKDEDYRLSFLFGNYVTLTRVDEADLERIVEQRLSPLFVSIHAFEPDVRARLLGIKRDDRLWEKLRHLVDKGIEMHGQVVLCPGINDGEVLDRTVDACAALYPSFRSLSVVPVGLTRHRENLHRFRRIGPDLAGRVVRQIRKSQGRFQKRFGESFVYLSDELYLLSGTPLPKPGHYGGFWQSDNGVGMTTQFLESFLRSAESFPERLERTVRMVLATGSLAAPVLRRRVLPLLNRVHNLKADVLSVENRFYGKSVTVSGLLTGQDIALTLVKSVPRDALVLIPSNCLNADGLFLDDWTVQRLAESSGRQIRVEEGFDAIWEAL